jgi:hypothetical protein
LNQTELSSNCCEKRFLPAIFKQKKDGKIGTVKNVVNFDEIDEESRKQAEEVGLNIYQF